MKRGGFIKRKKPWDYERKPLKRGKIGLRRMKLRVKGISTSAELKDEIQTYLRAITVGRYRGCILRGERNCGGEIGQAVLQADHLITRGNSATYADSRLVVCLCSRCHLWKKWNKEEYDRLLREILPADIVRLWDRCEEDRYRPTHKVTSDWKLALLALKKEAKELGVDTEIGRIKMNELW